MDPLFFGLLDLRVQMDPNLAEILHMQLYRKVIDAGQARLDWQDGDTDITSSSVLSLTID
uniref:hypothetical protein n=1 Tax=Paracoccus sp. T5 TaxID=3402161 RepID=UPI003AEEEA2F